MHLPAGLDETYDREFSSLDGNQQIQAIRALKWLAFSFRPLTLGELSEAVVIGTVDESSLVFDKEARLFRPADVLSLLPGLVVVDEVVNSKISELDYFDFVSDGDDSEVSDDSGASQKTTRSKTWRISHSKHLG